MNQDKIIAELVASIEAILFQVIQGKVLERDSCITQARKALANAKASQLGS